MSSAPTLLVAGYLTVDIGCRVDTIAGWDERVTALSVERTQGGMAANCACAAARLGTPTRFFGHTETGPLGDEALAALEAWGVDSSPMLRSPEGGSFCIILVGADGRRMIVSEPLDYDWGPLDEALAGWTGGPGMLYVDGYRLPGALERARTARAAGLATAVDLDGLEPVDEAALEDAAGAFDVLLLNRGIAAAVGADPAELAERLAGSGPNAVCVTLGADGAVVASAGAAAGHVEPVAVDALDTTGAGDAFAGAFLHRTLAGANARAAAAFANAAAALSTTGAGARGHLPAETEVLARMDPTTRGERQ
ncbi:MAG: carbohydrate kinase family protein [Gaiellaceae bacterium]